MDLGKVKCIVNWKDLETVTQVKLFLGFVNYYRRFITHWLKYIKLLIRLMKKDIF